MADIIIRGMEMPESCDECRLFNECWCMALGIDDWRKSYNKPPEGERLPGCPLVPLPEGHGKIVDAEEIRSRLARKLISCKPGTIEELTFSISIDIVDHADIFVPAEGGNADDSKP